MSRQISEAVRIELRGNGVLNSRAEFNRSRVPRLRVDLEGWKQSKKSEETSIQREEFQEEFHEEECSLNERDCKRKDRDNEENEKENKQKRPKRIKMDKLEGWGERVVEDSQDDNLPEGWWLAQGDLETETSNNNTPDIVIGTDQLQKKKQFKYKKGGKLNKAEIKELKKSCTSLLT